MSVFLRILLVAFSLLGCSKQLPYVWYSDLPMEADAPSRHLITPGDKITVQVEQQPELSGTFVVGASGHYAHPVVGLILVGGVSPQEAAKRVQERLVRFIANPQVTVTLVEYAELAVTVVGEVTSPGSYKVPHGSGVLAAIGSAGGLSDFADDERIYVVRVHPQPQRIRFRYEDLTTPNVSAAAFRLHDRDTVLVE
jgi:polysaccharide export outer membrane protein